MPVRPGVRSARWRDAAARTRYTAVRPGFVEHAVRVSVRRCRPSGPRTRPRSHGRAGDDAHELGVRPRRARASRWIPAIQPAPTKASSHGHRRSARPEDPGELERRGLLELVVAAVGRRLVRAPALERRAVAEAVALEVVVGDLRRPARRAAAPTTGPCRGSSATWHPAVAGRMRPPRRAAAHSAHSRHGWPSSASSRSGCQLLRERLAPVPRERRRDADVMERPVVVDTARGAATRRACPARSCASGSRPRRSPPCAGA